MSLEVDLNALRAIAKELRDDIDKNLMPAVDRSRQMHHDGAPIADRAPGGHVLASRQALEAALERAWDNSRRKVTAMSAFADAVMTVLANYGDADAISAQKLSAIEVAIAGAVANLAGKVMHTFEFGHSDERTG